MPQLGKGDGDQHRFPGQDVEGNNCLIVEPLVVGKEAGEKGCRGNKEQYIIVRSGNGLHPRNNYPAHKEKESTRKQEYGQKIDQTIRKT